MSLVIITLQNICTSFNVRLSHFLHLFVDYILNQYLRKIHNDDSGHLSLSRSNYFMLTFHVVDIKRFIVYIYLWYVKWIWYWKCSRLIILWIKSSFNEKLENNAYNAEIEYNKNPNASYLVKLQLHLTKLYFYDHIYRNGIHGSATEMPW